MTEATKQAFQSSHTAAGWIKSIGRGGHGSWEHPADIALPPPAKELWEHQGSGRGHGRWMRDASTEKDLICLLSKFFFSSKFQTPVMVNFKKSMSEERLHESSIPLVPLASRHEQLLLII